MVKVMEAGVRPREVVVIEDSATDAGMILRTLRKRAPGMRLTLLTNGELASRHLDACDAALDVPLPKPDLVIMDLGLPKVAGMDVLKEFRHQAGYEDVPVAVFTGSEDPAVWDEAYRAGANCVAVKPVASEEFAALLWSMARFWLEMPKGRNPLF